MTKPKVNLAHRSMQSTISKMRQIGSHSLLSSDIQTKYLETQVSSLRSSIRSIEHCICQRFRYHTCCTIILIFSIMIGLITTILQDHSDAILDFRNIYQLQSTCNISHYQNMEETLLVKLSTIESNIQQKVELIENDVQTVKTQEQHNADSISNIENNMQTVKIQQPNRNNTIDQKLFNKLSQTQSHIQSKINSIENEIKTIKLTQKQTIETMSAKIIQSDEYSNHIAQLKRDLYTLNQRINDIPTEHVQTVPNSGIVEKIFTNKIAKMQDVITSKMQNDMTAKFDIFWEQITENATPNLEDVEEIFTNKIAKMQGDITSKMQSDMSAKFDVFWQQIIENVTPNDAHAKDIFTGKMEKMQVEMTKKFSVLQQEIENMNKNSPNIQINKLQKTMEIWDTFMIQQNEMNDHLLKLFQETKIQQNVISDDEEPDRELEDFTVRVVYHTDIMTSSYIEHMKHKVFYFFSRKYDQNSIRPTGRIGDCTPLKQFNNNGGKTYIIFQLRKEIYVNGVTIEYIKPGLLHNDTMSAPKKMYIELSIDGYHYFNGGSNKDYHLIYNPFVDGAKKYFQFDRKTSGKYRFAKLNIIENHGAQYTCLYRVQIHGLPN